MCPQAPEPDRCESCPILRLEEYNTSGLGRLLQRANEMRTALDAGVTITLDEITALELLAMHVMREESDKWQEELRDRDRQS